MANYAPVLERTRGTTIESLHYGAATVVDSAGNLIAWIGNPQLVTFLRSAAKPFQALPFIERGGAPSFGLLPSEVAQICASHSGTNLHVDTVRGIQKKVGVNESHLQCGTHPPMDEDTRNALIRAGKEPEPIRHNCSGKHTGMLAHAKLRNLPLKNYLDLTHPVQESIVAAFAEMCKIPSENIHFGTDGCSAPNFAIPLYNAALGYARLCDPRDLPKARAKACAEITSAMMAHPIFVSGPGRFDTMLMEIGRGRFVVKGGAEGYQALGIMPGLTEANRRGVGIALKISDGDLNENVRAAVMIEILRQIGYLNEENLKALSKFAPVQKIYNWRNLRVGESRTVFRLERNE